MPLPRVMGWIEMGAAAAIVAGAMLGIALHDAAWSLGPVPAAVAVLPRWSGLALLTALPVDFAADVRRRSRRWPPWPASSAMRGRVLGNRSARGSLLASPL